MRLIELSPDERAELIRQHRHQVDDAKSADKITAILLLDKGYSRKEVSEVLLRDEDTITRWRDTYKNRTTLINWYNEDLPGYMGRFNAAQLGEIETYVQEGLIVSAQSVQGFIQEKYGLTYSISGLHALLHRLGFTYKQTRLYPSKMDVSAQETFKRLYEVAESHLKDNAAILFVDASHPQHNTHPTGVWVKKGQEKWVPSNSSRNHLNLNGAYNPHNQDVIIHEDTVVNAQTTLELFNKIEEAYPEKDIIYLITDNAPYYRSQVVAEYVKTSKIQLVFLPPYSQNLNLIERLWKFMKKKVINTFYYPTFAEFKSTVLDFFSEIELYKTELKQFIGTKMRLINPQPALA